MAGMQGLYPSAMDPDLGPEPTGTDGRRTLIGSLAIAAVLLAIFAAIGMYLERREADCRKACSDAGHQRYEYTAPEGGARSGGVPESCRCL